MITGELLTEYGAQKITLEKNEQLFSEGDTARYYYQVALGSIKVINYGDDGKEFVQGIFKNGQSLGEPPLFGGFTYPATAIALEKTEAYKLEFKKLLNLLKENFEVHLEITRTLSKRLNYKSLILKEISSYAPEHRIMALFQHLQSEDEKDSTGHYEIKFTRQQIASLTGLRVETVIRAIKALEAQGKVEINNRRVYLLESK